MKILPNGKTKPQSVNMTKTPMNKTLEGVLINTHYQKNNSIDDIIDFSDISNDLLISDSFENQRNYTRNNKEEQSFNLKKAMMPVFAAAGCVIAATAGVSVIINKGSKTLLNTGIKEQLPDLAWNMNIKQEPHFATYRMLRDPNFKNMIGAAAVFAFSGLTMLGKNFLNAVKEIWVKKQQADIERDLQENLIDVETQAFSGKLNVVNDMLKDNVRYFKSVLNHKTQKRQTHAGFGFRGEGKNVQSDDRSKGNKQDRKQAVLFGLAVLGTCAAGFFAGKFAYKNIRKTLETANDYTNNYTQKVINTIEDVVNKGKKDAEITSLLDNLFQSISAKPKYIKESMEKLNYSGKEIDAMISSCEEATRTIFADAPTALGGIPKKIQYYCYLDENRGHLYNWVIHPENKFTKYVFLSFSAVSIIGSIVENAFDMLKTVGVERENAKTELNLKKRLVDVEIRNFKAKKDSAIKPLIADFDRKLKEGASKQELKQKAENILVEIKNGPPYVYS